MFGERFARLSPDGKYLFFKESDEYFEKAMTIQSNMFEYYRRASAYALVGEKEKAFENLDKAVELGYTSQQDVENDPDLRTLRSDRRFQTLLLKLK